MSTIIIIMGIKFLAGSESGQTAWEEIYGDSEVQESSRFASVNLGGL